MTRRYFVPDLLIQSPRVSLSDEEAAHAIKVMRVALGESVELFDGRSHQCTGEVISVDRRACIVQCQTPVVVDREPARRLEIALSLPKPDRAKEMIERLTELGVARLWPIVCARTQREPSESLLDKLRRAIIEACKQSGRNELLEIMPQQTMESFVCGPLSETSMQRWFAMPGGKDIRTALENGDGEGSSTCYMVLIGPEGGFTDEESQRLVGVGILPVGLGGRIMRIETAAAAIASILLID